ncbi:MAG: hypothetical protein JXJ04_15610 [Spirochaetales bacterium]|nr:hypothetical protein [Spirochaetales bacterium]
MDYTLNELSIKKLENIHKAREILQRFISTCVQAKEAIGLKDLRIYEKLGNNLYHIELAENYLLSQWLNDPEVEKELKDRLRIITTSSPLITEDYLKVYEVSDFSYDGHTVYGLGAAVIIDTIAVSFLTSKDLNNSALTIQHHFLNNEETETIVQCSVKHASQPKHIDNHLDFFLDKQKRNIENSQNLWEKRDEFLPHLLLCGQVEKALKKGINSNYLSQIINRLKSLNDYASQWTTGEFSLANLNHTTDLNCSGESQSTMNKYGSQRRFKLPDGRREYFELHIKTGDLRFHFFPDNSSHKIYVGYIGKHLRIASEG